MTTQHNRQPTLKHKKLLYKILKIPPTNTGLGLCYHIIVNLKVYTSSLQTKVIVEKLFHDYTKDWPLHSGSITYPVPSPHLLEPPEITYFVKANLYVGEYGKLRKRLRTYVLMRLSRDITREEGSRDWKKHL